jgi:Protein of unknown function (DUF2911)
MRAFVLALTLLTGSYFAFGQNSAPVNPGSATASCDFSDQQQLAVQYQPLTVAKKDKDNFLGHQVPYGKIWEPGKQPLTLFTNSPLTIAGANVPVGAYTIYLIPNKKAWTLVLSKNTNTSATYDQGLDIVRAPMEVGILTSPEQQFSVSFEHTGPKECTLRVDIADVGAWVPFQQK